MRFRERCLRLLARTEPEAERQAEKRDGARVNRVVSSLLRYVPGGADEFGSAHDKVGRKEKRDFSGPRA